MKRRWSASTPTSDIGYAYSGDAIADTDSPDFDAMLKKMEKDGLINRSEHFRLEKDGNDLYINGKKQPESVYSKYRSYLKANSVVIKGSKGSLSISIND